MRVEIHFALRPLGWVQHRALQSYGIILTLFTTEPNLCTFNLSLILIVSTRCTAGMPVAFMPPLFLIKRTQWLFVHMDVSESVKFHSVFLLCQDGNGRHEEGEEWETATREREREREIARGDEIKFHLTLKNLLNKTNYFSKESFHCCIAVGLSATTWLRSRVRLFVFIMWRAAVIYFSLSLCLPLTQLICK